jgi:WD40 repeat protein
MSIVITCACGKRFQVRDELAGKRVKCPKCAAIVKAVETTEVVDEEPEEEQSREPKKLKKKSKRKRGVSPWLWVGVGGGLTAVVAATIVIIVVFGGGGTSNGDAKKSPETQNADAQKLAGVTFGPIKKEEPPPPVEEKKEPTLPPPSTDPPPTGELEALEKFDTSFLSDAAFAKAAVKDTKSDYVDSREARLATDSGMIITKNERKAYARGQLKSSNPRVKEVIVVGAGGNILPIRGALTQYTIQYQFRESKPGHQGEFDVNRQRSGPWRLYWDNGTPRASGNFVQDKRNGLFQCWDEKGKLRWQGVFAMGQFAQGRNIAPNDTAYAGALAMVSAHADELEDMVVSPSGKALATRSKTEWKLWDVGNLQPLLSQPGTMGDVAFSADGKYLAVSLLAVDFLEGQEYFKTFVTVYEMETGKVLLQLGGQGKELFGRRLLFARDGSTLFTFYPGVDAWEIPSGKPRALKMPKALFAYESPLHGGKRSSAGLAVSANGAFLVTFPDQNQSILAGKKQGLEIWDVASGKQVGQISTGAVRSLSFLDFTGDLKGLIGIGDVANDKSTVHQWSLESGQDLPFFLPVGKISTMAMTPDGTRLITHFEGDPERTFDTEKHVLRIWNVQTQKPEREWNDVSCFVLSRDGRLLAAREESIDAAVMNHLRGTKEVGKVQAHRALKVIDVASGKAIRIEKDKVDPTVFTGGPGGGGAFTLPQQIKAFDFLPDNRLVSAHADGTIVVWDAPSLLAAAK